MGGTPAQDSVAGGITGTGGLPLLLGAVVVVAKAPGEELPVEGPEVPSLWPYSVPCGCSGSRSMALVLLLLLLLLLLPSGESEREWEGLPSLGPVAE